MADTPIPNPLDGLQSLLAPILGSKTVGTDTQSLTTEQQLQQLLTSLTQQTQNTTGNTSQNTNQQNTNVVSNNADITALQKVFQQQQAGVTPEMLATIFSQGAKAVPQLVSTTANAVGARPSSNSALATSLGDLNSNLVNQAAVLNQSMLKDSASTAAQIAELTKQQTTAGTQTGSNQISTEQLLQNLLNQTQNQTQNTSTDQQKRDDSTSTVGINGAQTGIAAGLAALTGLLTSSGVSQDIINQVGKLFGSTPGGDLGIFGPTGGSVGDASNGTAGVGNIDYGSTGDPYNPAPDVSIPSVDDYSGGFADGGIVLPQPKLLQITDTKSGAPNISQLLSLIGLGKLGGSSSSSSGGGATAGGIDILAPLMGNTGGEGAASSGGDDSDAGFGLSAPGFSFSAPTPGQMTGVVGPAATGNLLGSLIGLVSLASHNISANAPSMADSNISPDAPSPAQSDNDSINAALEGATVGNTDSSDSSSIGVGGDSGGDGGSAASADAASGVGPGVGGDADGGWANGGVIPKQFKDPRGTADSLNIKVSGGEAIIPTDVVDLMGPDFFHSLISLYHTPAAAQGSLKERLRG